MNLALAGLPDFHRAARHARPQHGATCSLPSSITSKDRGTTRNMAGPSHNPLIEMTCPTMYDPDLAPRTGTPWGSSCNMRPYTLRDARWDDLREPYGDRVLELISEYAPNMPGIVEHRQVLTPLDSSGASVSPEEISFTEKWRSIKCSYCAPSQVAPASHTDRGYYLCGSGALRGGGVMGAPGLQRRREILKQVG